MVRNPEVLLVPLSETREHVPEPRLAALCKVQRKKLEQNSLRSLSAIILDSTCTALVAVNEEYTLVQNVHVLLVMDAFLPIHLNSHALAVSR